MAFSTVSGGSLALISSLSCDSRHPLHERLTAASVAALTVYDMCKAIDKAMEIQDVRLLLKTGGKSGSYEAEPR